MTKHENADMKMSSLQQWNFHFHISLADSHGLLHTSLEIKNPMAQNSLPGLHIHILSPTNGSPLYFEAFQFSNKPVAAPAQRAQQRSGLTCSSPSPRRVIPLNRTNQSLSRTARECVSVSWCCRCDIFGRTHCREHIVRQG